jgi:hypothetical protein
MPKGFTREMRRQKIVELNTEIMSSIDLLKTTRQRLREYLVNIQRVESNPDEMINPYLSSMDLFTLYRVFLERERSVY